jgi:uncharacterized membrane protein
MSTIPVAVVVLALLGSALIGGVFFTFSSFMMKSLARLPGSEGIAAMQSINIVVINPSFLGAFTGTAALSIVVVIMVLVSRNQPSMMFLFLAAIFYFVGTFLVTIFGNVPLNERLAAVSAADPEAINLWVHYLNRWTLWNHVRTAAALAAALLYTIGLMQSVAT